MDYATNRLIDSVWTMAYEIKDNHVIIHSYDRDNAIGYEQEKNLPQFSMIEGDKRIVTGVIISEEYQAFRRDMDDGIEYTVANPKFVFSYDIDVPPEITVRPNERYLDHVTITGTAINNTPKHMTLAQIKDGFKSSLADAVYLSHKVSNILEPSALLKLTNETLEGVTIDVASETLSLDQVVNNQYEQKITLNITQKSSVKRPVLTEDVLQAAESFQSEYPKPFKEFKAEEVMAKNEVEMEQPVVRTLENVKKALTETLDNKYTVSVSAEAHDSFLVEIHNEYGLVERLPSYQPNFEHRYASMLENLAAPKEEVEHNLDSPRMSR